MPSFLIVEQLTARLSPERSEGKTLCISDCSAASPRTIAMGMWLCKARKIIISCLTQIVASAEFNALNGQTKLRLICAAARQVVRNSRQL